MSRQDLIFFPSLDIHIVPHICDITTVTSEMPENGATGLAIINDMVFYFIFFTFNIFISFGLEK